MQSEEENTVCWLCLKLCKCSFQDVGITTEMLKTLRLQLYLDVSGKSVLCKICSDNLQQCFDFKTICAYTEDCINSFRNERNEIKLGLRDIYLRKNENKNNGLSNYHTICRLCMKTAESGHCIPLNVETKDVISAKTLLRRYFSELDLSSTENPYICASCNKSLHSYCNFVKKYLEVKDEIKNSDKIEDSNDGDQVNSNIGLQLEAKNTSDNENGYCGIGIHKNCNKNELYDANELKLENIVQEDSQELRIKHEAIEYKEIEYVKVEKLDDIVAKCDSQQNGKIQIKCENIVEVENNGFNIKHEEINTKTEEGITDGLQNNIFIQKNAPGVRKHSCEICTYKAKYKGILKRHMLIHEKTSEVAVHACEICTYKTKWKSNLTVHMLVHKNTSEVEMQSCQICTYKTKQKSNLKKHMLIHKNASEVPVYFCEMCTYKSGHKSSLKQHMLIHKNTSEVAVYSCELCTYKSKYKSSLQNHILIHRNASEVTMHSCELCAYKSKHKSSLKQHILIHKNPAEIRMYSCELCTYKAKRKSSLKEHVKKCFRRNKIQKQS